MLPKARRVRALASRAKGATFGPDGLEDVPAAGMNDDPRNPPFSALSPEAADGSRGKIGHRSVEKVAELAVALLEAELVAMLG